RRARRRGAPPWGRSRGSSPPGHGARRVRCGPARASRGRRDAPPGHGPGGQPYGAGPAPGAPTRGVIAGAAGVFTVTAGLEMRVGRDGATCQILLTEPRVSGNHATLKFE